MSSMPSITARDVQFQGTPFFGDVTQQTRWRGVILSELAHPRPRRVPFHAHESAYFSLLLSGEYAEGGEPIAPMTVSFLPMGGRHDGLIGPRGAEFFTIEIAEEWLEEIGTGADRCAPMLQKKDMLLWAAMRLYTSYRENRVADSLLVGEMIAELAACATRERESPERNRPMWLTRAVEMLTDRCAEDLALNELAAEARVHPVHLERTFRKFTGTTLGAHLHHVRVERACEMLLHPEHSLAEIAVQTGFADQPHFTRVFRRLTGITPGRFRALELNSRRKSASLPATPS
jgi:AraC family transcriptional regulator